MRCKGSYIDAGEKLQDALMVRPSAHSVPHNLLRYTHTHICLLGSWFVVAASGRPRKKNWWQTCSSRSMHCA